MILAAVTLASCRYGSNFSFSGDGEDGITTVNINDETGYLKIKAQGKITFSDDELDVKSISPGGYISFKRNGTKIRVNNNSAGELVYEINGSGQKTGLNANDKKLLAKAIKEMINVGFDAKGRAERIYIKGGATAVMNAADDIRNDYVKSIYFDYLLTAPTLSVNEMTQMARKIGMTVNSDYEKSNLLKKFPASYLENDQTASAYLDAINTIGSDFEKANAAKSIADQQLTQQQYGEVLNITNTINSDFEKANVLKQLIHHGLPEEGNLISFLTVTDNVNSDFEKANVLKDLLDQGVPPGQSFNKFLNVTSNVSSDFERANILKKLALKNIAGEDQWISLIIETEKVSSENERSGALVEIAKKMPVNDRVKTAYLASAKTITSDYEYGQAVKAVR